MMEPTIPPSIHDRPMYVKARDSLVGSVMFCTALRATPTAPARLARVSFSLQWRRWRFRSPLKTPMAKRMVMADRKFLLVPNAMTVRAFPRSEVKRTARLPCFSAIETHSSEVRNCERKKTEL